MTQRQTTQVVEPIIELLLLFVLSSEMLGGGEGGFEERLFEEKPTLATKGEQIVPSFELGEF